VIDQRFRAMGCDCRVLVDGDGAASVAERVRAVIGAVDARLSRFRSGSELSRLNADPREAVPASPLVCAAVNAALYAARASDGLVDPTLLGPLERWGYVEHWDETRRASLDEALAAAPARRPARASRLANWRNVRVESRRLAIVRPPGVRLDLGGVGKGFAADLAVAAAAGERRVLVDCGGDIAVGGRRLSGAPFRVGVADPFGPHLAGALLVRSGAVATSGIDRRIWWRPDGRPAHHVLDPSTSSPVWSGVVSATAVGRTAAEAERLAKCALLLGPVRARRLLAGRGGVLVLDDGQQEWLGPVARPHEAAA
jgi:thiamine biosynthesis lipoprotein